MGTSIYAFVRTSVTTSADGFVVNCTLKNVSLVSQLADELADNTSGSTAVVAGFYIESMNYKFKDDYLTRLFSALK